MKSDPPGIKEKTFDQSEKSRLGKLMRPRQITLCHDETFHPLSASDVLIPLFHEREFRRPCSGSDATAARESRVRRGARRKATGRLRSLKSNPDVSSDASEIARRAPGAVDRLGYRSPSRRKLRSL